jgi:protein-L-isoaspartate(D-aspartate) O-methyltransferase
MKPFSWKGCLFAAALVFVPPAWAYAQFRTDWTAARNEMVDREIVAAGVKNPRVIEAMRQTPRHEFVPPADRAMAYYDMALPIGHGQTISPPFIVAYMTEQIDPQPDDRVLEIGTGSGYQAAVLSGLVKEVYTIEIVEALGRRAARDLKRLKYTNVYTKVGDGYKGWPEKAPFDKIIVTCSPEKVPPALVEQLREGGTMIIPVGERYQQVFYLLKKEGGKLKTEALRPTLFVPMTGEAEKRRTVLPDPLKPAIVNGSFEDAVGDPPEPANWHYQRQLELIEDPKSPSGRRHVRFTNAEPGRGAQALQGFAVDGRQIKALRLSAQVAGKNIAPGQNPNQLPLIGITFYDENRAVVGDSVLGPWRGTFPWQIKTGRIAVPPKAREAVMRIGLLGATGELLLDEIRLEPADRP